ncbi:MAG TPA: nitrite reductase small subunit NirD [Candidatus Eisenbacteria bacterium]|jgi:NAD(P)H-dependent nitrite reductase small subunit|nr:nitrite reductase small subunit NirD [Candidatus Eisenbacteria bacterium]
MGEFVSVVRCDSIRPGAGCSLKLNEHEIAVFNVGGTFYALDGRCPHRGGPLGVGCVEDSRVYCPLHGWGFDLETGACIDNPERPVKTYPTRVRDGEVQIYF